MARLSLSLLLLLGCTLLQHTRAEFGSLGTVQSSATIKNSADQSGLLFDELDAKNGYVPKTNYALFSTVLPLIESLGTQTTTLGMAITTAISTGVPKHDGNLNGVFNPILSAITPLIGLIDGEQAATRTTLTTLLGSDIDHLFGDVFGNMRIALQSTETAMGNLKTALAQAAIVNGRARVAAGVVGQVLSALNTLRTTIPPVRYTIHTTIENVEMGDQFLFDLEDISTVLTSDLQLYLSEFTTALEDTGNALLPEVASLDTMWSEETAAVPGATTALSALPEYADFGSALSQFNAAYSSLGQQGSAVEGVFQTYLSTAASYLVQYEEVLIPRDYLSITYVLEVLISGGPHSQFCFFKYSPRLVNYYSMLALDVENCFNVENDRLFYLYDVGVALIELITYDLEDLIANLTVCNGSSMPADCIGAIGPLYLALAAKTNMKVSFFQQYATAEANASVNRLGACIYTYKLRNVQQLFTVKEEIELCRSIGPDIP